MPVNVAFASVANPEMEAPAGIVTVPVKVGSASGAFKAIDDVREDDKDSLFASEVAISPRVSNAAGAEFIKSPITVFTYAVVAICVLLVVLAAVGARGVPVRVGESKAAITEVLTVIVGVAPSPELLAKVIPVPATSEET